MTRSYTTASTQNSPRTWRYTAVGGETTLSGVDGFSTTLSYAVGGEQLFVNGVLLERGVDYTATNGTSVTLSNALVVGDLVTIVSQNTFAIANALPLATVQNKGDLIVGTASGAVTNLGVGADGSTLVANSSAGGGVSWAGPTVTAGKNLLINGAMEIDQRNNGASVTPSTTAYTQDRWQAIFSTGSKFSCQKNAGSVTPPAGFAYYFGVTSTSAYSVETNDYFGIQQFIEGFNIQSLAWGTSSAKNAVLSFWVYTSLAGTYTVALRNGLANYSYPATFTVSSANTWTKIAITIPGPTSGTWSTDNTAGIAVWFTLGSGSTYTGTANTWAASNLIQATGSNNLVGTNGATFYFTGVQFELGSVATAFSRAGGTLQGELAACQRYYYQLGGVANGFPIVGGYLNATGNQIRFPISFPTNMRIAPAITVVGTWNTSTNTTQPNPVFINQQGFSIEISSSSGQVPAAYAYPDTSGKYMTINAEL